MKAMEERILREGSVLPGGVLKVGSFLNQQIDAKLLKEIGEETARLFAEEEITKVLTIESSGIAIGTAIAMELGVPMVFAKKHKTSNVDGAFYSTVVHSYTHNTDYTVVVSKEYISAGETVLIVDDFLACGNAVKGLMQMVEEAGATLVGVSAAIEKGFQGGGDALREKGIHVESLAVIDSMDDNSITFRA